MSSNIHGYFFQDITAERVIGNLIYTFSWDYLDFLRQEQGEVDRLVEAVKAVNEEVLMRDFMKKVEEDTNLKDIYGRFETWAGDKDKKDRTLMMVETLAELFTLEVNLPYQGWYGRIPQSIEEKDLDFLESQLSTMVSKGDITAQEKNNYLQRVRGFMVQTPTASPPEVYQ